jgi:hypothetical protein
MDDVLPPRLPFVVRFADKMVGHLTRVKRGSRIADQLKVLENLPDEDLIVLERIIDDETGRRALVELAMVKSLLPFWGAVGFCLGMILGGLIPFFLGT